MARSLIVELVMLTRLDTIVIAQKKTRIRDVLFACFIALAATVSVTTVATAANAAHAQR